MIAMFVYIVVMYTLYLVACTTELHRLCFYTTDSVMVKSNFLKEIRTTFGAGGFVCSFNEKELVEFHQFLERSFPFDDPSKVKKGVYIAGKQANNIWVVSKDVHIDGDGSLIRLSDSVYSWQPISGPAIDIMVKGSVVGRINLECDVKFPLESGCLSELLHAMQEVFKHNFIASKLSHT